MWYFVDLSEIYLFFFLLWESEVVESTKNTDMQNKDTCFTY